MAEYKELINRLRQEAEFEAYLQPNSANETPKLLSKAADAIEKLSKPKWIPVTERLPKEKINQNTHDFEYVLCATVFGDVRPYKYGRAIGSRDAHFWNGAGYVDAYVTHWMPLTEPPKEE